MNWLSFENVFEPTFASASTRVWEDRFEWGGGQSASVLPSN